jgi:hypothetical protein
MPDKPVADDLFLAEKATAIRALGKRVIADVIEIGRLLAEAKERCGHGNWLPWLDREFGWSGQQARRFIHVHELSCEGKFNKLLNLAVPISGLYLLAAPSTPQVAKDEVIERGKSGAELSHNTIKGIVDKSKPVKAASKPSPKPEVQPEVPPEPAFQVTDCTMGNDTDPAQSAAAFAAIHAAESERVTITPPALSAITERPNLLQAWDQASEEDRESFLDALGVNAMLKSMSAQFKSALHAHLLGPAPSTEQVEPAALDHTDCGGIPRFAKREAAH